MDSRRSVITVIARFGLILLSIPFVAAIAKYLTPDIRRRTLSLAVCRADDLNEASSSRTFTLGSVRGILARDPDGKIIAFDRKCTHLGCMVIYRQSSQDFFCNCHHGTYNLAGQVIAGPPPKPLTQLQAIIKNDVIVASGDVEILDRYS